MAFTFTNYAGIQPQQSPIHDMIGQILSGYTDTTKARYLQPQLQEELNKAKLVNKYYGPNIESQIGLRGAQAGHLGSLTTGQNIANEFAPARLRSEQQEREFKAANPFFGQTGTSGDLGRLLYLQDMIKKNPHLAGQLSMQGASPQEGQSFMPSIGGQQPGLSTQQTPNTFDLNKLIQDAFSKVAQGKQSQFAPSNTVKDLMALSQAEQGLNPSTNLPFRNEQEQKSYVDALKEKTTGAKKGTHYVYDPVTKQPIGTERPLTQDEHKKEEGRAFFNDIYPDIYKGINEYMGKDSVKKFNYDAMNYGKNDASTNRIDNLLYAQMLLSAGTVNEAATLGAGKTNQTFNQLKKSLAQSDIPRLIEEYEKGYVIPNEAFKKAPVRFQEKLNSATERAASSVPATKIEYYEPEKHLKSKEEKSAAREEQMKEKHEDITPEMAKAELERRRKKKNDRKK